MIKIHTGRRIARRETDSFALLRSVIVPRGSPRACLTSRVFFVQKRHARRRTRRTLLVTVDSRVHTVYIVRDSRRPRRRPSRRSPLVASALARLPRYGGYRMHILCCYRVLLVTAPTKDPSIFPQSRRKLAASRSPRFISHCTGSAPFVPLAQLSPRHTHGKRLRTRDIKPFFPRPGSGEGWVEQGRWAPAVQRDARCFLFACLLTSRILGVRTYTYVSRCHALRADAGTRIVRADRRGARLACRCETISITCQEERPDPGDH